MDRKHIVLHEAGLELCKEGDSVDLRRILLLQSLERNKTYKKFDKATLFSYVMDFWKWPEDVISQFLAVARKGMELPSLQKALESYELKLQKLTDSFPWRMMKWLSTRKRTLTKR